MKTRRPNTHLLQLPPLCCRLLSECLQPYDQRVAVTSSQAQQLRVLLLQADAVLLQQRGVTC
jgi:hypothetical protein